MTTLATSRPVTRESCSLDRGRPIVVTMHPTWLEFRAKGTRTRYSISIEGAFWLAVRKAAEEARAAKKKARKRR